MSSLLDTLYTLLTTVFSPHDTNTHLSLHTFLDDDEKITKQVITFTDPDTVQTGNPKHYKLTLEPLEELDSRYL